MTSPIAGPSAATNGGQGALGGFEALLAAFFGPTDQAPAAGAGGAGLFAAAPEGVAFSILFMNMFTPLIDRYTRPQPAGGVKHTLV